MNKTLKTGIFAVVAIVILFAGWAWLGEFEFKKKGYEVILHFPDVTGLKVNDPVRVGGVEKGQVKYIQYQPEYIEVKVIMEPDVKLYKDATSAILDVAMISGTKYIELKPGNSGIPLPANTPIEGKASHGIPLSMLGEVGAKIDAILYSIQSADMMNSIAISFENLKKTTEELSILIRDNQKDLKSSTENIKNLTEKLDKTVTSADMVLDNINKGKGTLGRLTNEDSLYDDFRETLLSIKELANDIKANPKRYLKLF